jgi:uncharacterized protein YneF (UPF0154 family)
MRKLVVLFIVIGILLLAFGAFFFLKRATIKNYQKYPPTTDCTSLVNMFDNNFDDTMFKHYATLDKDPTLQA